MTTITLQKKHLPILSNKDMKDEFVTGLASILKGEEPQTSDSFMKKVFYDLVHGKKPKVIPGIPQFDPTGMKKNELDRYKKVQAGMVPSGGLDHRYADLQFKPIKTLKKDYLSRLYDDCLHRVKRKEGSANYRRFISYLAEVMKHCANSGELV